ncbi:GntR family transcriptional regulator [Listeria cossartiae subsp. cayugensis]|uniref:GntR family transcriptional regulator n=1 Tax=Listeria cossartiae TaxID=2838249 RepID=UPI002880BC6D|nr:GntR family transcriptional regulator [Listeria cossartiae]MDT0001346.1 GntR family transcriptional regulator [Listeria cossartiae subsp. cayugensis]MDT0009432.1 GntR family transcriptional regulator [Listeria cossartiae subsp. cayugensis]MDT0031376.1 GntR family transcriptional regulator [Listeria cossartiae subsp. cayugensis]MDT0039492.1 GntR family transcriptional regulator [Listeria cossartiae subsp. cayugensis]MDT0044729.1 GntR family transcriptional regulator [Listeria cossartiae subs
MANKFKTLDKMVYNLLLEKIKNGELVVNQHLAEEKLATEFGVSRSPLRKAIATLTAQGIVSYHENSGAVLNDVIIDAARYVQLMETIDIFVDAAIVKAAHFGYEMDVEKLHERVVEMERFSYLTDVENYFEAHHRFILCLISFAENPYQVRIAKQIFFQMVHFSDGINIFKSVEIREWTNKKSKQIYELLAEEKTEMARKTIKSLFAELTIQAYR